MSSAQLEISPTLDGAALPDSKPGALRQQAAERLAAHRLRRGRHTHAQSGIQSTLDIELPPARSNKIAAAVAERYAHSPSYRAFLAQEAQRAIEKAAAAAEVAARNAEAVATAQQSLLAELELWTAPQEFSPQTARTHTPVTHTPETRIAVAPPAPPPPKAPVKEAPAGLVVRLGEAPTPRPASHAHQHLRARRQRPRL